MFNPLFSVSVFTALDVGEYFYARNPQKYSNLHSARIQAQKFLNKEVALNRLEKREDYYCVPDYRGEHKEHSRLLTQALVEILKLTDCQIFREHLVPTVALRPDAICLITKDNFGICFILEVVHNETPDYLRQKINAWRNWDGALNYLSNLFNQDIPHYSIVVYGQPFPDTVTFEELLKEVKNEGYDIFHNRDSDSGDGIQPIRQSAEAGGNRKTSDSGESY